MNKMIFMSMLMAPFFSMASTIFMTPAVHIQIKAGTGVNRKSAIKAQLSYQIYCNGREFKFSHLNPLVFIDADFSLSEPSGDVVTKNTVEFKNGKAQIPAMQITDRRISKCQNVNLFYDISQIEIRSLDGANIKLLASNGQMAQMQRQGKLIFDIHTSSMREQSFIEDLPFFNAPLSLTGQGESVIENLVVVNLN